MTATDQVQPLLRVLPWAIYLSVALVVCMAFTFPYDILRIRVLEEIRSLTGFRVTAAQWGFGFPLGLIGHEVTISRSEAWDVLADQMAVSLSVPSLLSRQPELNVTALLPSRSSEAPGLVEGKVLLGSWPDSGPLSLAGRMEGVDLGTLKLKGVARGRLHGTIAQQWQRAPDGRLTPSGEGTWGVRLEDLVIERLSLGRFELPALTIVNASGTLHCQQATCQVLTFKGNGPDGSFIGTGTLTLGPSLNETSLAMDLLLTPEPGYVQGLAPAGIPVVAGPVRVQVSGSLAQPSVSL